jgi:hypothetical protein
MTRTNNETAAFSQQQSDNVKVVSLAIHDVNALGSVPPSINFFEELAPAQGLTAGISRDLKPSLFPRSLLALATTETLHPARSQRQPFIAWHHG